jgi:hypothetical protein
MRKHNIALAYDDFASSDAPAKTLPNAVSQPWTPTKKSSIAVLSPRLELQQLRAVIYGEPFLIEQ